MNKTELIYLFIAFTGALLAGYALLIFYFHRIWNRIPRFLNGEITSTPNAKEIFSTTVSVIVPARNEEYYIEKTIQSLLNQSYPDDLTELIIVNDFSTDGTVEIVQRYQRIKLLNLEDFITSPINSYKKKAIETAINHSNGELIICSDADCFAGPDWIRQIVMLYEKQNVQFIAAPVRITANNRFLSIFQTLDFLSLQGITGAAVYKNIYPMCNGANLAYTRKAYDTVNGFQSIDEIASGDDMLLMKKIQDVFPGKLAYLKNKEAIVSTYPADNIRAFFNQRIRWASKILHYQHPSTFFTLLGVYLVNFCLFLCLIFSFFYDTWRWLIVFLVFKTISEVFFVRKIASFFSQQSLIKFFPLCQPFHILYTVIAGAFGSFGRYEWKNRKVK